MSYHWLVGAARADITAFIPGIVMLGYGNSGNTVKAVDTPLQVRAFWLEDAKTGEVSIMACLEVCFITQSIVDNVWEQLHARFPNFKREHLLLSAQHTHSAPSGYTHYALYSVPTPGFSQDVLDIIVRGTVKAIEQAYNNRRPSKILYKEGQVPTDAGVSFNRSLRAYNRNIEVERPLGKDEQALATDRSMRIFEFVDEQGPFASWNWFAVHCTNIIWNNHYISPGNKGYAALYLEEDQRQRFGREDYIGVFAQGNAGDVSPIEVPKFWSHWFWGNNQKMIARSKENGMKQFSWARRFLMQEGTEVEAGIDGELVYADFSNVKIEASRTNDLEAQTSPACFGVAFAEGAENAGVKGPIKYFLLLAADVIKVWEHVSFLWRSKEWREKTKIKYYTQKPKHIFVEAGAKKVLGTTRVMDLIIPGWADRSLAYFKRIHRRGGIHEHTWTQHVLPLGFLRLGQFALVSIPAETTTMAGSRLARELSQIVPQKIILAPYSMAYCGYITTPEEYEAQCYEGGHTVFGRYTLPAFAQHLSALAKEMLVGKEKRKLDRVTKPPQFTHTELNMRRFEVPAQVEQSELGQ